MYRTFLGPISGLQQIIDSMDRTFNPLSAEAYQGRPSADTVNNLPVDIWEKDNTYFIRAAVPGVSPENLDVQVQDGVLTLSGEIKHDWEGQKDARFWRLEYAYGKFARSIRLPENVVVEQIHADFSRGFVTITIPQAVQKPKVFRVPIATENESPSLEQNAEAPTEGTSVRRTNGTRKEPAGVA